MKKVIYIGTGGAVGAVTRFVILQIPNLLGFSDSTVFTILINITGSFLLGFMLNLFSRRITKAELKLGITTGFLGGYTTFSTFCKDTVGFFIAESYFFQPYIYFHQLFWDSPRFGREWEQLNI